MNNEGRDGVAMVAVMFIASILLAITVNDWLGRVVFIAMAGFAGLFLYGAFSKGKQPP